ncbi:periplasmic sensor diguanylate cyclase/phosphodiesterase [Nitrosomonas nitrosa]|uniref:Periplasmic sensor diguanylate cyclase/phosphodiesterase n=1 Tax=Nitrosomonas nitrosa TaxID=52442 RepID=A0A1I4UE32_9PROT|nr:EAL domain-containing protein [Nitrosomonas nitrosa]SFM87218.1 periplasmic sensor diguanylate cyclase/phosphodiesterase [Nitrosomonas nitrosa]
MIKRREKWLLHLWFIIMLFPIRADASESILTASLSWDFFFKETQVIHLQRPVCASPLESDHDKQSLLFGGLSSPELPMISVQSDVALGKMDRFAHYESAQEEEVYFPPFIEKGLGDWILSALVVLCFAAVLLIIGWSGLYCFHRLSSLSLIVLTLAVSWFLVALYRNSEINEQKYLVSSTLVKLRSQLENSINSNITLLKGLLAHIQLNPYLTQAEFEQIAKKLIDGNPNIRNIAAAPDLVIRMLYPFEENQQAINLDYRRLPDQLPAVLKAKEQNQIILAGPVKLVQGGLGLIGRLAVHTENELGQQEFWGLVSSVIHAEAVYQAAGLYDPAVGLKLAIRGKDGTGSKGEVFFGDPSVFNEQAVIMNISVPGGSWQIGAIPIDGWASEIKPVWIISLLGLINIILIVVFYRIHKNYKEEQERNKQYISHLAYHDSLTGLSNRAQFMDALKREIAYAKRNHTIIAVLMLDLDYFKQINDTLGHLEGDRLLKEVAQRLRSRVRKEDLVARLGGDEFAILQRNLRSLDDASILSQKLIEIVSQPYIINQAKVQVGASIGIAHWQPGLSTEIDLLEQADTALYKSKDKGRGCFTFHTSEMTNEIRRRLALHQDLKEALNADNLFLVYQPKINTVNKQIMGVEALLRWNHPTQGFISPAEFIPIAETHGMMHRLGFRILEQACATMNRLHNQGIDLGVMSVNISPLQLDGDKFQERLIDLLNTYSLSGDVLELELTERIMVEPRTNIDQVLNGLAQQGIKFSLDDFGTGYSSLLRLKHWPFHQLKIAQEFVRDMLIDSNDQEIVKATIALAKNLELEVIAEGVEKNEQLAFLQQHGCYLVQGYLLAYPMTETDLLLWLKEYS